MAGLDNKLVEKLINWLQNKVFSKCILALEQIGESAVPLLIETLKDENSQVSSSAAKALGGIGDVRAVELLIQTLTDKDNSVRFYAAEALGIIGDARAIEPLILTLENYNLQVRCRTAEALGKIGDVKALSALEALLQDTDIAILGLMGMKTVGEIAAEAIEKIKEKNGL